MKSVSDGLEWRIPMIIVVLGLVGLPAINSCTDMGYYHKSYSNRFATDNAEAATANAVEFLADNTTDQWTPFIGFMLCVLAFVGLSLRQWLIKIHHELQQRPLNS